jgi:putative transposase
LVHLADNKKLVSEAIGINRKNVYFKNAEVDPDLEVKNQIETCQVDNPSYGHRRIAWALKMNHKKIQRVMRKYGIKVLRRKIKHFKKEDTNQKPVEYINVMKILCPLIPSIIWVTDFTYIKYKGRFIYVATVMDFVTREVLGISISRFHDTDLVLKALMDAISKTNKVPKYVHSDQGSEYKSERYVTYVESKQIIISMSDKASPWQNGRKESFFGRFKEENGDLNSFETLPELIEYIYKQIYYYNNKRIHTSLRMSPVLFKQKFKEDCLN